MIERHAVRNACRKCPLMRLCETLNGFCSYVWVLSQLSSSRHFGSITNASCTTFLSMRKEKEKKRKRKPQLLSRSPGIEVDIYIHGATDPLKAARNRTNIYRRALSQGRCWYRERKIEIERYDISGRRSDFSPSPSITITFRLFGRVKSRRQCLDPEALKPTDPAVVFFR